jgi:hypothetical protein
MWPEVSIIANLQRQRSCPDKILARTYWFNNPATYTYQYWVVDQPPCRNAFFSKTADPYSTLVLSPFDDGGIPAASYPICLLIQ